MFRSFHSANSSKEPFNLDIAGMWVNILFSVLPYEVSEINISRHHVIRQLKGSVLFFLYLPFSAAAAVTRLFSFSRLRSVACAMCLI